MTRLIPILILIHLFTIAKAQSPLCLLKDNGTGNVDFRAEELNNFLQLDKYRAIFFGEQHNAGFDPEIKYHLITDLNKRTGLRHVFLEMGFSSAWNINQFAKLSNQSAPSTTFCPLSARWQTYCS